jgi:4,5-DOPA dioxygenase extradiol
VGILVVSAHWESAPLALSAVEPTGLIYDFGGFNPRYYRWQYETPAAHRLADLVTAVLPDTMRPHQHPSRGLDHGAWVPISLMYPEGDIPVLQLSLPTHDAGQLLGLGARLRELRDHGVLVVGSGFLTHGLPFLREWRIDAAVPGWSRDFDLWAAEALGSGDVETLADFARAPGMPYAHPTVEHLVPLFVTLGMADDPGAPITPQVEGYWFGLAKRSFQVA